MMIRPAELAAIKAGRIDLAFRRWAKPRVVVGTRMRTAVGVVEVTSVERAGRLTAADAERAGAASLQALKAALAARPDDPVWCIGLAHVGPDPREALREQVPDEGEIAAINARLDRLDKASAYGAWTRATLDLIDLNPTVRAPDLAAQVGRETADFKKDVRKLKELGMTESLDIGYLLSPRGQAVVDAGLPTPRERAPQAPGTRLPRVGAPATRALRAAGITTLEQVAALTEAELAALHGVGPIAIDRLRAALAERGFGFLSSST
ncbi:helix-hairpin-helix domain-containing protein [Nocardioides sp.]|uniref:helix-hairpin-helix domain-containing protein n=1 Tax=Nocardioides sp. TaxID=35761 RepID=UPI002C93A2E6|nr:helix-hairpin-helix domain-containing protein [Nocardioides sp.]HXH80227.1 helix-hairpin-helix domain-containing protein [Nocardioides sp.]